MIGGESDLLVLSCAKLPKSATPSCFDKHTKKLPYANAHWSLPLPE